MSTRFRRRNCFEYEDSSCFRSNFLDYFQRVGRNDIFEALMSVLTSLIYFIKVLADSSLLVAEFAIKVLIDLSPCIGTITCKNAKKTSYFNVSRYSNQIFLIPNAFNSFI